MLAERPTAEVIAQQLAQLFHDTELLVTADLALYEAKRGGRNQVRAAPAQTLQQTDPA